MLSLLTLPYFLRLKQRFSLHSVSHITKHNSVNRTSYQSEVLSQDWMLLVARFGKPSGFHPAFKKWPENKIMVV